MKKLLTTLIIAAFMLFGCQKDPSTSKKEKTPTTKLVFENDTIPVKHTWVNPYEDYSITFDTLLADYRYPSQYFPNSGASGRFHYTKGTKTISFYLRNESHVGYDTVIYDTKIIFSDLLPHKSGIDTLFPPDKYAAILTIGVHIPQ